MSAAPSATRAVLLRLAGVEARPVSWLWPGRIPLGKVSVLDGDPGLGKSTLMLDLVARVSRGLPMPDGARGTPGGAIILSAEDAADDTIVPRLQAAGADLSYVAQVPAMRLADGFERPPVLPGDLAAIEQAIKESDWELATRLVVIDPFVAFLSEQVDSWRDQDVRRALHALADFAEATQAAVVVIRHLTKANGTPALYRGGGSIGIIGAARAGLLVARDPEDPAARVLAVTKMNLAAEPPSLSFRLDVGPTDQPRIVWSGESPHGADVLVSQPRDDDERREAQDLRAFLWELLELAPRSYREVEAECRKAGFDVSGRTLRRAGKTLGVVVTRHGFGPGSSVSWSLNGHSGHIVAIVDRDITPSSMATIGQYDAPGDGLERPTGRGDAWEPEP